jgi:hypothetical protein
MPLPCIRLVRSPRLRIPQGQLVPLRYSIRRAIMPEGTRGATRDTYPTGVHNS